ncbi:hypothetical protein MTR67_022446 [Solanum verrucosum]|uniref:Small acidic protein n=1 Tax=Solanum verrucosum TaxID=315347 RepID=A0AAF0TQS4_SOLVR|nr:hypothetical protein MTR67_022446 [Solanum verrucosum]
MATAERRRRMIEESIMKQMVIDERRRRIGEESTKKPMVIDYLADMEEQGSTMAIDVDNIDNINMFGEGLFGGSEEQIRVVDSNFFNRFQDDFDDSDIN